MYGIVVMVLGHGRNHSKDFHPPDWHSFYLALLIGHDQCTEECTTILS